MEWHRRYQNLNREVKICIKKKTSKKLKRRHHLSLAAPQTCVQPHDGHGNDSSGQPLESRRSRHAATGDPQDELDG